MTGQSTEKSEVRAWFPCVMCGEESRYGRSADIRDSDVACDRCSRWGVELGMAVRRFVRRCAVNRAWSIISEEAECAVRMAESGAGDPMIHLIAVDHWATELANLALEER